MTEVKQSNRPRKAKPKGKRRYPKGLFHIYDETYDLKQKRSPILSAEARERDIRNAGALIDEKACKNTMLQLIGNPEKNYFYLENRNWKKALIPSAKIKLHKLHREFKLWAEKQVDEGYALSEPTEWPKELFEKRLKAEAILDIYRREKAKVKEILEQHESRREKERKGKILEYGPAGLEKQPGRRGNKVWSIDGQRLSKNGDGIPYIDEPSSPYHLMPLFHYRQIIKEWRKVVRKKAADLEAKIEQENKGTKFEGTARVGKLPKRFFRSKSNSPNPNDFPDWPDDAKEITDID